MSIRTLIIDNIILIEIEVTKKDSYYKDITRYSGDNLSEAIKVYNELP